MRMRRLISDRTAHGLACMPRWQQRRKLDRDTRRWLADGHHIHELPPGRARGLGSHEQLNDILKETGLYCEY